MNLWFWSICKTTSYPLHVISLPKGDHRWTGKGVDSLPIHSQNQHFWRELCRGKDGRAGVTIPGDWRLRSDQAEGGWPGHHYHHHHRASHRHPAPPLPHHRAVRLLLQKVSTVGQAPLVWQVDSQNKREMVRALCFTLLIIHIYYCIFVSAHRGSSSLITKCNESLILTSSWRIPTMFFRYRRPDGYYAPQVAWRRAQAVVINKSSLPE